MRAILGVVLLVAIPVCAQVSIPLVCTANSSVPPVVRAEGLAELTGDLVVVCSGGTPTAPGNPVPAFDLTVFLNTNVTSRILGSGSSPGTSWSEALLLLDEPPPSLQFPCTSASGSCPAVGNGGGTAAYYGPGTPGTPGNNKNVLQGLQTAVNSVTWTGVPIDPPGPAANRVLRITNIRANATALAGTSAPGLVQAAIGSISGPSTVPLNNPVQTVGYVQQGSAFQIRDATGSAVLTNSVLVGLCGTAGITRIATLRFAEWFNAVFKRRSAAPIVPGTSPAPAAQNVPGTTYNTETGFYNPAFPADPQHGNLGVAGLANSGTRMRAVFNNIPPGVDLFVDPVNVNATSSNMARLIASETGPFAPAPGGNPSQLTVVNGTAVAAWEILGDDPFVGSALDFGVYVRLAGPGNVSSGAATVSISLAPVSTTAVASASAPLPRFVSQAGTPALFTVSTTPCTAVAVAPATLSFTYQYGSSSPGPAVTGIMSSGGAVAFSITTATSSGGNWLNVTASAGVTPATLSVSVSPAALAPGQYSGAIVITAPGATNSPITVGVSLTVTAQANVTPASLSFTYQVGAGLPAAQNIDVASGNAALSFTASASVSSGNWLQVSPASGATPVTLSVTVNPAGLAAGYYVGNIQIGGQVAPSGPVSVPVSLAVTAAPSLIVPKQLTFQFDPDNPGAVPPAQAISVSSRSGGAVNFTAMAGVLTPQGRNWLVLSQTSGVTPAVLNVSIDPTALAGRRGTFVALIRFDAAVTASQLQNARVDAGGAGSQGTFVLAQGTGATSLTAVPAVLSFDTPAAGGKTISVDNLNLGQSSSVPFHLVPSVLEPQNWLVADPLQANTRKDINVSVNPADLAPDDYLGMLAVQDSVGNIGANVSVSLAVTGVGPLVRVSDSSLALSSGAGVMQRSVQVTSSAGPPLQVVAAATSVGNWLSVTPTANTPATLAVSANATGLAAGDYPGSISITAPGAVNSPVSIAVTLSVAGTGGSPVPNPLLSQIADGQGWKTSIILANTGGVPSPFDLKFWKGDGTPLTLPLGADGSVVEIAGQIAVGGSRIIETDGVADALLQGWAELTASQSVGGQAIFRQRVAGQADSEAAVPLVPRGGTRLLMPFDNTAFVTGMALVNTDQNQSTNVSAIFRDETGAQISSGQLNLPAHGQLAFSLSDQFQGISGRGVAEFTALPAVQLAGLGLRFNSSSKTFTSFDTIPLQGVGTPVTGQIVSQVVDGMGWTTTIILVNTDTVPVSFTLRFWKGSGSPLPLALGADGTVQAVSGQIPVGGARTIQTDGVAAALQQGWAELVTSQAVSGTAVFRQQVAGQPDSEAAVPVIASSGGPRALLLPFDCTQGFATGVALVNPDPNRSADITVNFRDENGSSISTGSINLPARGQTALNLTAIFPAVSGTRGVAEFSAPGLELYGLGLRFSPAGTFTSLPTLRK